MITALPCCVARHKTTQVHATGRNVRDCTVQHSLGSNYPCIGPPAMSSHRLSACRSGEAEKSCLPGRWLPIRWCICAAKGPCCWVTARAAFADGVSAFCACVLRAGGRLLARMGAAWAPLWALGATHPRTRNFSSWTWALALQKSRGGLRLVDISRTPSGTFFLGAPYLGNG